MMRIRNGRAYEVYEKEEARRLGLKGVPWREYRGAPNFVPQAKYVIGDDGSYHEVVTSSRSIITLPSQVVSTRISCYLKDHQDDRWRTQVFPFDDPFDQDRQISPRERKVALTYISTGFNALETYHKALARNEMKSRMQPSRKNYDLKKRVEAYITRPAVEKFIVRSIQSTLSSCGMDDDYLVSKLRDMIEDTKRPNIALEALKIGFKLAGHLDKQVQQPPQAGLIGISYEEVMKIGNAPIGGGENLLDELIDMGEDESNA